MFIKSSLFAFVLSLASSSAFVVPGARGVLKVPTPFSPSPSIPTLGGNVAVTGLQMSSKASADDEKVKILKMVDEEAWEGVDLELAKKIVNEIFDNAACVADSVPDTTVMTSSMSISAPRPQSAGCAIASLGLAIDVVGLVMTLLGLPSKISKKIARKIVEEGGIELITTVGEIALLYFKDATNLLDVATGLVQIFGALTNIFTIGSIINIIFGEMSWWEVTLYSALITANIALLFAASAPAIVIKLALVTGDVVAVVQSTVDVVENCGN